MTKKLDEQLPQLYAELHERGAFLGKTWEVSRTDFVTFFNKTGKPFGEGEIVLDFGCGPNGGLAGSVKGFEVISYDPYVPLYNHDPWQKPFTTFFSSDVLEHLPEEEVLKLLRRLRELKRLARIYLVISTRHANKTFSNGLNVHLTVRPVEWWHGILMGILGPQYNIHVATADLLARTCTFGLVKKTETWDD